MLFSKRITNFLRETEVPVQSCGKELRYKNIYERGLDSWWVAITGLTDQIDVTGPARCGKGACGEVADGRPTLGGNF